MTLESRVQAVHSALAGPHEGIGRPESHRTWFARQVEARTGYRPSPSVIYRWLHDGSSGPVTHILDDTLETLETTVEAG